MNAWLLALAWLTPLLMLPWVTGRHGPLLATVAPLPALASALLVPVGTGIEIPWLLLRTSLNLDATGATFLLFSSLMWLFAALYAALGGDPSARGGRFGVFYLLACSGNLLLIIAADFISFYIGFALMGLAATGLIAQRRSQHARRAARVYLAWTLIGELALFAAIAVLADRVPSLRFTDLGSVEIPGGVAAMVLFGFGIKLALPGLHVWLPLAYPAAPVAAAAVLSGPMISAGLLGWLRFLPPGNPAMTGLGDVLLVIGTAGSVLGVMAGLAQRDPRTVLAYSSVAKMGLVAAMFGIALATPTAAAGIHAALVAFAMHHLMLKGTMFLGIGEWRRHPARAWPVAVLGVLALALIGAPLTSGAGAKLLVSESVSVTGLDPGLLFAFSTAGTVLLMARFLWLIRRPQSIVGHRIDRAAMAWLVLATLSMLLPLGQVPLTTASAGWTAIATGGVIALMFALNRHAGSLVPGSVPPGDVLYLATMVRRLCAPTPERPGTTRTNSAVPRNLASLGALLLGVLALTLVLMPG